MKNHRAPFAIYEVLSSNFIVSRDPFQTNIEVVKRASRSSRSSRSVLVRTGVTTPAMQAKENSQALLQYTETSSLRWPDFSLVRVAYFGPSEYNLATLASKLTVLMLEGYAAIT
jgi:hypothetical protein